MSNQPTRPAAPKPSFPDTRTFTNDPSKSVHTTPSRPMAPAPQPPAKK